jgi:hypothetical protein
MKPSKPYSKVFYESIGDEAPMLEIKGGEAPIEVRAQRVEPIQWGGPLLPKK